MRNFLSAFTKKTFLLSVFIIFIILNNILAQTVVPFSISGTWTCPAGVTSIQVECWGGGGAGGGSNLNTGVGGGGGGGGYAQNLTVPVTPGTVYTITVGAGGAGVVAAPGGNGALSSFNSVVIARGGNGGALGSAITGIAGGPGGTAHTGTITFNGGNGGTSASARTGGGGGGAGSTGNGGNAVVNTAGLGTTIGGGNGAAGIISSGTGNIGITCGGGGSGAFGGNGANANQAGGAGARGQVVLTFTQPVCPSSTAVTPAGTQSFCLGNPANVLTATITTTGTGGTPTFLYQWYFNATNSNTVAGATIIASSTSQTYTPPTAILGTRFYFCVGYATNNSCGQTSATQSLASNPVQVTVNGILPGTYSVGPTGTYSSIGAALSIISGCPITGPFIFELQPSYVSSVEIFPISIPAYTGISSVNSITIRPAAGAINLTLSTSAAGGTIVFNGGDYMIFDGRPAGLGIISQLAIINTNTSGSAVEFVNDASNNILRYCTIQGVTTSTVAGVLEFVGSTGTTGNDNNLIDFCTVKAGATTPTNIIYSAGSVGKDNSNNTISNSLIQDFFAASAACNGIFMGAATTDWTISGNSFFQTASRTFSSINARMIAIYLDNNATGNNTQILNNKIGGTSANCGGTALTLLEGTFSAIKIQGNPAASTPTVILGNTIANIALTTTSTSVNPLIYHVDGAANILSNTIGNQSTNGNIRFSSPTVFTAPSTAPILTGIMAGGALTGGLPEATIGGSVNILNNTIGGITVTAISLGAPEFRGIDVGQVFCTFAVTGNTVGSLTVANSISNDAPYRVIGIISFANKTGVIHTISNNIVANLICTNTGAAADQRIIGIQAQGTAAGGTYHVTGNTVFNLTSATSNISRAGAAGIRAVNNGAASDGTIIANNLVYNISNTNTGSIANTVLGLEFRAPTTTNNGVYNNRIYQLNLASSGDAGQVYGIYLSDGTTNVYNNSISLGFNAAGTSITNSYRFAGIAEVNLATGNSYYFNTINIAGTAVTGAANTYGFYSTLTAAKTLKNNIFYNARSNGAGTGKHYGYFLPATGVVSDYNTVAASGAGGVFGMYGATDYTSLTNWITATTQDANSEEQFPVFVSATNLKLQSVEANGLINNSGIPIPGITSDIDAETRNTLYPDPGFDEIKIDGSWIGPSSSDWLTNTNWETNIVPTTNISAWVRRAGNFPLLTSGTGIQPLKNLYMKGAAASIILNGGGLRISGTITNIGGSLNAINGTIELNGTTAAQNINGGLFVSSTIKNFTISNPTGVNIGSTPGDTLKIGGLLKFGAVNNTVLNTGNNLTLLSSASGTASVGDITNGGVNSGNSFAGTAIVERYINTGLAGNQHTKGWQFVAAPVGAVSIKNSWMEGGLVTSTPNGYGSWITAPAGTGGDFDAYSALPSIKTYNTSTSNWATVASATANVNNKQGYMLFVRGDRSVKNFSGANSAPVPTVLRAKGQLITGAQTSLTVAGGGFQTVANPYPSAISFALITKVGGVGNDYKAWDPSLAGTYNVGGYQTMASATGFKPVPGNAGNLPGVTPIYFSASTYPNIQSGQAIFISSAATAGSLSFNETNKTIGSILVNRETNQIKNMATNLMAVKGANMILADGNVAVFGEEYSNEVDANDAIKLLNGGENFGLSRNTSTLAVEAKRPLIGADTLFYKLGNVKQQAYRLMFTPENLNTQGLSAELVDKFLNTRTPVSLTDTSYTNINFTTDTLSTAINRFMLVFKVLPVVLPVSFVSISAARNADNSISVNWSVEQQVNVEKYEVERSADGLNFVALLSALPQGSNRGNITRYIRIDEHPLPGENFYRIKAYSNAGKVQYSAVAKVFAQILNSDISVNPNPVVDKIAQLQFINQDKGMYDVRVINAQGQVVYAGTTVVNSNYFIQSIPLGQSVPAGVYQLQITSVKGIKIKQALLVQ